MSGRIGSGGDHSCGWTGCERQVSAHLWGCESHWFKLPERMRRKVWRAYVPGQSLATQTDEYRSVMAEVQTFIQSQKVPELF